MGAVHFSIDHRLIAHLRASLPLEVFVETGTYEGDSVDAAHAYFDELHTIEVSDALHARASARFRDRPAIDVHHGSSPDVLSELSDRLRGRSILYWLDAHFCCRGSGGSEQQCPLLAELDAIGSLASNSVVLIDDARLFMAPPPAAFAAEQWPSLTEVISRLSTLNADHELIVIDDVIVFFPPRIGDGLREFAREHAIDWLLTLTWARKLDADLGVIATELEAMQEPDSPQGGLRAQLSAMAEAAAEARTAAEALMKAARAPGGEDRPVRTETTE